MRETYHRVPREFGKFFLLRKLAFFCYTYVVSAVLRWITCSSLVERLRDKQEEVGSNPAL
jgi:hypothetical protein